MSFQASPVCRSSASVPGSRPRKSRNTSIGCRPPPLASTVSRNRRPVVATASSLSSPTSSNALKASALSESALRALWVALDSNDSGFLETSEFHRFMKREEQAAHGAGGGDRRSTLQRQKTMAKVAAMDAAHASELAANRIVVGEKADTAAMRAELEAAGVRVPSERQQDALSEHFNA